MDGVHSPPDPQLVVRPLSQVRLRAPELHGLEVADVEAVLLVPLVAAEDVGDVVAGGRVRVC